MKKTGYLYDKRYLLHETGSYHPETPDRLIAIHNGIVKSGLIKDLILIKATMANLKWIEAVHDLDYIKEFEKACISGTKTFIYPDNQMCKNTYKVANLAVGGIIKATNKVMNGEIDNVFCAVRPPGHHAEHNQAMGFCYFNNVAIAANYLIKKWNLKRVGIIDFDVHHGNGTQHLFEKNPKVFYYSIHQHPSFSFPGTGRTFDIGINSGSGFTKNSTVLPGQKDKSYNDLITNDLLPEFDKFKPEIILVSTGFDAHIEDEMSDINLSTEGFSWIMETIYKLSEEYSNGKLISILEGGYNLNRLPELASNHVKILLNK